MLYCIPLYSNNWFWNQNQAKFWENAILIFLMQKIGLILQVLNLFSPLLQFFLTFGIELMVPTDSQILVDDFRHQNFGIWTILSWIMAIFMKKWGNLFIYKANQWFCTYFGWKDQTGNRQNLQSSRPQLGDWGQPYHHQFSGCYFQLVNWTFLTIHETKQQNFLCSQQKQSPQNDFKEFAQKHWK